MSKEVKETVSKLRWLSLIALVLLFVSDYGFNVWAKSVPKEAYGLILAVAIGIDIPTLRDLMVRFLTSFTGDKK